MGSIERIVLEKGRLACRSFRRSLVRTGDVSDRWKLLWELLVPLKVKSFDWLLLRERVAMRDKLYNLEVGGVEENVCP